jgi:hypothetical protein
MAVLAKSSMEILSTAWDGRLILCEKLVVVPLDGLDLLAAKRRQIYLLTTLLIAQETTAF